MITSPGEDGEDMKIKWNTGSVRTGFDFCLQIASRESRLQHDMDSNKDDKAVLYTHTPEMPMYPGISRDIQGIQLAKSTVWTPHWMVCATQRVYRVYFFCGSPQNCGTSSQNSWTKGQRHHLSKPMTSSSDFLRFYKIHAQAQNPKWSKWGQLNQLPNTPKIICVQVPHIPT